MHTGLWFGNLKENMARWMSKYMENDLSYIRSEVWKWIRLAQHKSFVSTI